MGCWDDAPFPPPFSLFLFFFWNFPSAWGQMAFWGFGHGTTDYGNGCLVGVLCMGSRVLEDGLGETGILDIGLS